MEKQPYIALLRGVNVAGRTVKMDRLRALFGELGFSCVRTYIQSGNVLFDGAGGEPAEALRGRVEEALRRELGFEVSVVLLTAGELRAALDANPFAARAPAEGERVHVTVLRDAPDAALAARLSPAAGTEDEFALVGRTVFILCRNGYGRTVYNNSFFENKLKVKATTRNLETMTELAKQ